MQLAFRWSHDTVPHAGPHEYVKLRDFSQRQGIFSDSFLWQQLSLWGQSTEAPGRETQKPSNTPLLSWDCHQVRGDAETWQTSLDPSIGFLWRFLPHTAVPGQERNLETFFFFFLVSGINTFLTSLLFEIYSFDSQTHFQPCIMCSNTALLVYLPHKCCCYCLDVTSSDELAGARNSLLVLALCITSGMRWPPGNWFLVSPCSGNFIRGVSALFDKNRMNFKENASRSSSEQRRDVKANDAEA